MKRSDAFVIWFFCTVVCGASVWKFSDDFPIAISAEAKAVRASKEYFEQIDVFIDWFDRAYDLALNGNDPLVPLHVLAVMFVSVIAGIYLVWFLPFVVGWNLIYFVESLTGWPCVAFWTSLFSFWVAGGLYQHLDA